MFMFSPACTPFVCKGPRWWLTVSTLSVGLTVSGCATMLDLQTTSCLNPETPLCSHPELDSRQLAVRVFQLKKLAKPLDVNQLDWEAFRDSAELPEVLKPHLAVPADAPRDQRPKEEFFLKPRDATSVDVKAVRGARYLLIVPRGRQRGELAAMQLVDLGWFGFLGGTHRLCFHGYDVYSDATAWPCRRD